MATLKVSSLGDYIREQRESAQVSLRQLAKTAGVSNPYLSQIERGMKKPSAEILAQIAKGLRISAETLYVHAGILDEREPSDVVAAILADPAIGERHRRILLDVYASFRAEHAADVMAHSAAAKPTATTKTGTPKASAKKATAKKASAKKASATSAKKTSAKKTSATKATKASRATQTRTTPTQ
jgi:transcriptional regulator with XRE-family HTH domain